MKYVLLIGGVILWSAWALAAGPDVAAALATEAPAVAWWIWPIGLFGFCLALGVLATLGGIGGGVLFVPLLAGFFPFHLDFVRGAGLLAALAGALSASPALLKAGLVNLRLTLLPALIASVTAIVGAMVGLILPPQVINLSMGLTILGIVVLMLRARKSAYPVVTQPDALTRWMDIHGVYHEPRLGRDIHWRVHRMPLGLVLFSGVGFLAGLFGLGAGWANVPVLNLVLGAPLKVAVASSLFIIVVSNSTAAWVYLHNGAVLPFLAVPSILGMMLGARLGAVLLKRQQPALIRKIVIGLLLVAGGRALLRGLGI
ncbi:MAG: sulfite exporter TauE/SafE family protein [Candidatus Marinimicrobia bacterium]|nr:sulfite exporter TauE/SafE family protein [Candidatus Neomarinimicrobiota bacterium]